MTLFNNTAEGQANGTVLSAANSGGGSGTAFSSLTTAGTGTGVFDISTSMHGSLSYHIAGASGFTCFPIWSAASHTSGAYRIYVRVNSTSPSLDFSVLRDTGGVQNWAVGINSAKQFVVKDAAGATLATLPTVFTFGTWYRIEVQYTIVAATSTSSIAAQSFVGDSTTVLDSYSSGATVNIGAAAGSALRLGKVASGSTVDINVDDISWNTGSATALGPTTPPVNVAPTIVAGSNQTVTVGSSVTLTGAATDSDGTISSLTGTLTGPSTAPTLTGSAAGIGSASATLSQTATFSTGGVWTYTVNSTDSGGAAGTPATTTITVTAASVGAVAIASNPGGWALFGSAVDMRAGLNDADDTTGAYVVGGANNAFTITCYPLGAGSLVTVSYKAWMDLATPSATLTVTLKQGGTTIQTWSHAMTTTATSYVDSVTTGLSLITDRTALSVVCSAN